MNAKVRGAQWFNLFSKHAKDLYPGRYTEEKCLELADQAEEIKALAKEKGSLIVSHNYLYPEFHEVSDIIGDSLGLSQQVKARKSPRVDFGGVFFMGETAKIITGENTRVFVQDTPEVLGCSLVSGTDEGWISIWKENNPGGIVTTYVNSSARVKAMSDYIVTSRNAGNVIQYVAKNHPGGKMVLLPDKFLGYVMKGRAVANGVDGGLIDIYEHKYKGNNASCYVHEDMGSSAIDLALDENPDAELLIHPECGCASSCLLKLESGEIPNGRAYYLSTEQMVERARGSTAQKFLVATEKGMVYRLRKEIPEKTFIPVSYGASCKYMKGNTFDKLLDSLRNDKYEIVLVDKEDDLLVSMPNKIGITTEVAKEAKKSIDRMLAIT